MVSNKNNLLFLVILLHIFVIKLNLSPFYIKLCILIQITI